MPGCAGLGGAPPWGGNPPGLVGGGPEYEGDCCAMGGTPPWNGDGVDVGGGPAVNAEG